MATVTIRQLYDMAVAILFERYGGDDDFDQLSPQFLSRMLQEALPYENQIREYQGREKLKSAPMITLIDDTVLDWDDNICKNALVHGLASCLLGDESNKQAEALIEYNKFVQALDDATPAIPDWGEDDA